MKFDLFRSAELASLKNRVNNEQVKELAGKYGTPLFLVDKQSVLDQYDKLVKMMPSVTPHFAIKSCPMPELLEIYKEAGIHLDVASEGELAILKDLDYPAELLIHTHPHKSATSMKTAYDYGIRTFVLDDLSELSVIEPYKKDVELLLRLGFSNQHASIDLSYKFGLDPAQALEVIGEISARGFTVIGCSFHVGSQMANPEPYRQALQETAKIYKAAGEKYGLKFRMLDIGGGFPSAYVQKVVEISEFAAVINKLVDNHFKGVKVVSEPGRYLINSSICLITRVVSKTRRGSNDWLFIDDGVYGSFSDMLSGHMTYNLYALKELDGVAADVAYIVAGPTCDSIDVVAPGALLPETVPGELLIVPNMGAYSYALSSQFNSIPKANVVVI